MGVSEDKTWRKEDVSVARLRWKALLQEAVSRLHWEAECFGHLLITCGVEWISAQVPSHSLVPWCWNLLTYTLMHCIRMKELQTLHALSMGEEWTAAVKEVGKFEVNNNNNNPLTMPLQASWCSLSFYFKKGFKSEGPLVVEEGLSSSVWLNLAVWLFFLDIETIYPVGIWECESLAHRKAAISVLFLCFKKGVSKTTWLNAFILRLRKVNSVSQS